MLAKAHRLTKRGSFSYVYRAGKSQGTQLLRLVYVQSRKGVRIGFSVSNKVGKAVRRNKLKRRLRAIVRDEISNISPCQAVFVASPQAVDADYQTLKDTALFLLKRAKLGANERNEKT